MDRTDGTTLTVGSKAMIQLLEGSGPDIPSFYEGRSIFITGGTGFMGKVLVERLLTTCPDVKKLYLLMREKKGLTVEKRLQQLKQNQVFDVLRVANPGQLDKLVAVAGDVTQSQLGLTQDEREKIWEVSVVFHSAATVKMQEQLKQSVDQNLRSVIAMLQVCDTLPKLDVFVHVSTAYSNAELSRIEEKVYPPPMELKTLLDLMENHDLNEKQFERLTTSKPNTYTFTKAMAEHAVDQHGCARYPVAIFRPSIVISSMKHPLPGWIDNLNGPSGVIAGTSTGQLRVFRIRGAARADMVPVDIAIDTLIAVAWETATDRLPNVRVYNCSSCENPITWVEFKRIINSVTPLYPSRYVIMYPHLMLVENSYAYHTLAMLLQTVPAHVIEFVTTILGVKKGLNLIRANQKLQAMHQALEFFTVHEWHFVTNNTTKLRHRMTNNDRALFNLDPKTINWSVLLSDLIIGTRKYVLKQDDKDLANVRARVHLFRLFNTATKVLFALMGLRYINHWLPVKALFQIYTYALSLFRQFNPAFLMAISQF